MAYAQILGAAQRGLQRTAAQYSARRCSLLRAPRPTFLGRAEAPSSAAPSLSCCCFFLRGVALHAAARNKSKPEEREQSVSRYQGGSPKPSAAQKGEDDMCPPLCTVISVRLADILHAVKTVYSAYNILLLLGLTPAPHCCTAAHTHTTVYCAAYSLPLF